MATSLINTTPAATYESLLKLGDNSALSATLKRISDGAGNDTPIEISTAAVQFGGSTGMYWDNTNRRLGIGTNAPTTAVDVNGSIRAGVNLTVVGEIQNPTVGVVNINGELRVASPNVSIGLTSYPARLAVRGSGTTSSTTALRVENSAGTSLFDVRDDGYIVLPTAINTTIGYSNASRSIAFNYTGGGVASGMKIQGFGGVALASYDGASYIDALTVTGNGTQLVGIGTTSPTARLQVRASGSTSATTAFRVENSTYHLFTITDDGTSTFTNPTTSNAIILRAISTNVVLEMQNVSFARRFRIIANPTLTTFEASNTDGFTTNSALNVGGSTSNNASAILQADSTTKGFLPPRMTTTQKNAIASPAAGLVVYDTTTNKLCCYNGTTWNDLF